MAVALVARPGERVGPSMAIRRASCHPNKTIVVEEIATHPKTGVAMAALNNWANRDVEVVGAFGEDRTVRGDEDFCVGDQRYGEGLCGKEVGSTSRLDC